MVPLGHQSSNALVGSFDLGHVHPASTAVYLTITAELMEEANQRFNRFAAPLLKEVKP